MKKMFKKEKPVVEEPKNNPFGVLGVVFEKLGAGGMLLVGLAAFLLGSIVGV